MSIFGKRNNVITYTVNKATNRDMYITIQNGEVIVNAPWYFTQNKIQAVVEEKKNWILSKINEYQQQSSNMQSVKIFGKNYDLKVVYSNIDTPELNIEENYEIFVKTQDLSGLMAAYQEALVNQDQQVRVLEPEHEYDALALGIDKTGELQVECEDGSRKSVFAGEGSVRGIYGYV